MTIVLSVGGSIISPEAIDTKFIIDFTKMIKEWLSIDISHRAVLVTGGGSTARRYQNAAREITNKVNSDALDWIGIMATRLNAQLLKTVFGDDCMDPVVTDPTSEKVLFQGRVLVAAGWKPGFSTDNDAALLAKRFGAGTVINLSNIERVYTADPRKDPAAKPIDRITWGDFCKMVGSTWSAGGNYPFDPVASIQARECAMRVICCDGRNIDNTKNILMGKSFVGTVIEG